MKKENKLPRYVLTVMDKTKYYDNVATSELLTMYKGIADALKEDEATPEGQPKPYGVLQNADLQEQSVDIEIILDKRGECYTKIIWP